MKCGLTECGQTNSGQTDSGYTDSGLADSGSKDAAKGNAAYRNAAKRNDTIITLPNNSLLSTAKSSKYPHICILITISAIIPNDNVDYVNVIHVFAEDTHTVYK